MTFVPGSRLPKWCRYSRRGSCSTSDATCSCPYPGHTSHTQARNLSTNLTPLGTELDKFQVLATILQTKKDRKVPYCTQTQIMSNVSIHNYWIRMRIQVIFLKQKPLLSISWAHFSHLGTKLVNKLYVSRYETCGSMTFWCGSGFGSADPCL